MCCEKNRNKTLWKGGIMLKINFTRDGENDYNAAHEFARNMYLLPRMNMHLYYRPSVLFCATIENKLVGVMGLNVGLISNEMLSKESKILHYTKAGRCCEQSVFALDGSIISVAPIVLSAILTVYAAKGGFTYLAILAIPITRKIITKLGVASLSFGKPDKNLLSIEHLDSYDSWFKYNDPTSIEIVVLSDAKNSCSEYLKKMVEKNKILLCPLLNDVL